MDSQRLRRLLDAVGLASGAGCGLFQWRLLGQQPAQQLYKDLASRGVLVRVFNELGGLRFGLPRSEAQWQRLESALRDSMKELAWAV
tara:strand:- start:265 stop:525 length:261 start_codon:yes stop_codon:yes gene_type:complete